MIDQMKKYGIFGGAFNPPHIAHCIVAESVRQQLELDKIIFIPSGNPPLKNSIPEEHRMAMALLAFGNNENFIVSDIEVQQPEVKSYTVDTLIRLHEIYENSVSLVLIIGYDNLITLNQWKQPERLFELAEVVVVNRPEYDVKKSKPEHNEKATFVKVPHLEISSTQIRKMVSEGKSVRYLVNEDVEDYIKKNKLYLG